MAARHAAALRDLQRLPAFLRLLGLHVLQVGGWCGSSLLALSNAAHRPIKCICACMGMHAHHMV